MESEPLHIAMISIHSSPVGELGTRDTGGMSVYIRELSRELGKRGHRIDIFTRSNGLHSEPIIELAGNVRLVHLSVNGNGNHPKEDLYTHLPAYFSAMEEYAGGRNRFYDLIHSHYWLSGELGLRARERWSLPHVFMYHTIGVAKNEACADEKEPPLRIAAEERLGRSCHRLLTAAERDRQLIKRLYGVSDQKIGVVPCGVNLDLFHPMDRAEARSRIDVDPSVPLVLYVGRFAPVKGIRRLLNAIARLQDHRKLQLMLIGGDGPDSPVTTALRQQVHHLGIADRVFFAGRIAQRDLPLYYNAADVLVVASYYESFGLVALESMACGTPVVTTPVGAMESIVHNGINGEVIASPSVGALASGLDRAIRRWWRNPPSAARVRDTVRKFRWSKVADAVVQEYETVLDHR